MSRSLLVGILVVAPRHPDQQSDGHEQSFSHAAAL